MAAARTRRWSHKKGPHVKRTDALLFGIFSRYDVAAFKAPGFFLRPGFALKYDQLGASFSVFFFILNVFPVGTSTRSHETMRGTSNSSRRSLHSWFHRREKIKSNARDSFSNFHANILRGSKTAPSGVNTAG